jgi:hypothetical protein
MELIKIEIRAGRDLYYYLTRIYHTLTDVKFWLVSSLGILWLTMFGR